MTRSAAKALGYYPRRGSFVGGTDDRCDRWYIANGNWSFFRPFGPGYRTQREAWDAIMEHAKLAGAAE